MIMENAFAERKEAILNALIDRKGIQYLTDIAAEMLGNPMLLYDISGKVLSYSNSPGDEEIALYSHRFFGSVSEKYLKAV